MKVSIICSVYNREKYIHQCIDSILGQSLRDFELILIDNGCSDACPSIIDEYAQKDSRVIAIHNNAGSSYGKALNQGIEIAEGEYIGIVESDDFIKNNMYEKLYKKAIEFDADVAISGFYIYTDKEMTPFHVHNKQIFDNSSDRHLFGVMEFPFLFTCHQSIWCKLYKNSFLKKIKFDEEGRYIDSKFIVDLFCTTDRIIAVKEPLYYYRNDNPDASQSNSRNDLSLNIICDDWMKAKKQLKLYGKYEDLKEEFWYQASKSTIRFYQNSSKKYKKIFFEKLKILFSDLRNDNSFKYKYFEDFKKLFIQKVLSDDYIGTVYESYSAKKIWGMKLYEKYTYQGRTKKKLLGLTLESKTKEKTKYLGGVFIKKNRSEKTSYYLLGIKVFSKDREIYERLQRIENKINTTISLAYNISTVVQACHINKNTFAQYKGAFIGKKAVLVACGTTLSRYSPIKDAIHIGVNRAFKYEKVQFDYIFVQDKFPEGMDEINSYRIGKCQKFYGILPPQRSRVVYKNVRRIPLSECIKAKAFPYIIQDTPNLDIAYDLSYEPVGDFQGCVFSALQFLMYAHPEEIYLVGCDCSSDYVYQMKSWIKFSNVLQDLYYDIKVYSINPIGLRGLFHDISM